MLTEDEEDESNDNLRVSWSAVSVNGAGGLKTIYRSVRCTSRCDGD